MDALPTVNRLPLRNPSPILGSGSLSLLPATDVPPPLRKTGPWFDSRRKRHCFPLWQPCPPDLAPPVQHQSLPSTAAPAPFYHF
jgi:hypothetical protein